MPPARPTCEDRTMRGLVSPRARRLRSRLTYANVIGTLALFLALGGASYAALALPANSVETRHLAFPLGLKSRTGERHSVRVLVCPPRRHCPRATLKRLLSLHFSVKKSTQLLLLAQVRVFEDASTEPGATSLDIGMKLPGADPQTYSLSTGWTTVSFWRVVSAKAGRHATSLVADAASSSGPARTLQFDEPRITVIALPALH
jgi:hypothetical protein